jgi:UDP-3-O-[3-hydroxymyristoyl] N-acetylglucosamine deacetylase
LLRALLKQPDAYELVTFDNMELAPHSYLKQMAEQWLPN